MVEQTRKKELFKKLNQAINSKLKKPEAVLFFNFVQQYYHNVALEELESREISELFSIAYNHWELINARKPGECKIHIFNPHYEYHGWQSRHTIVQVAHEDMPFLVDSIRMAIMRMGLNAHLMIHVGGMKLKRDSHGQVIDVLAIESKLQKDIISEAPIHIEIDKQTETTVLENLKEQIESALIDVRRSVIDWPLMLAKMDEVLYEIDHMKTNLDSEEVKETKDFLKWLVHNHFTFLGYRKYIVVGEGQEKGLKMVPDSGLGVLRHDPNGKAHRSDYRTFASMSPEALKQAISSHLLIISKTNTKATVHRDTYTDYIGIKVFDHQGELIGEHRFIGLYTSIAYTADPKFIPFVRLKFDTIMRNVSLPSSGHAAKALRNILETFPRDDLFQASTFELTQLAMGILNLQERKRIRMFSRVDVYRRFISCLVYVPKERFDTDLGYAMQEVLAKEFEALEISFTTWFAESTLARIHYVIRIDPQKPRQYDYKFIEEKLIEVGRTWKDDLRTYLIESHGEEHGLILSQHYQNAFPAGYREIFDSRHAVYDIHYLETLTQHHVLAMNFYRPIDEPKGRLRFKLFGFDDAIPLSDVVPVFENMGLKVIGERPYHLLRKDGQRLWICDFSMSVESTEEFDIESIKELFQDAFLNVWFGKVENDSFNRLVLSAKLSWKEIRILRAYARYLRQTEFTYSQPYIESTFNKYPHIARMLIELFLCRFEPEKIKSDEKARKIDEQLKLALEKVATLDEDKIIRTFYQLIFATLRTNYFQASVDGTPKSYLSFKLDPKKISVLPLPLPMFEIFVYSPRFEGVHLRNFYVARGGIRWSDRPEDFRTEILGLMKAQNVKNAIIVPSGSKGGFVPKRISQNATRDEILAEGIACYENFIRGLLDLTDNLQKGKVIPPQQVVRHDEDDTYLVVAADKGTATFSDIANNISAEYDFWLGDAFASGGSSGYDHKKMGITARGAWESVKRHFRMLGHDTQKQDFTVIGIGDMSGDVFGNGILLSQNIQLVGAFDHRHIFIDPTPDPKSSFAERKRLFELPRSSWADYNLDLISQGGGVFERRLKSIALTPQIKSLLNLECDAIEPNDLIIAMLKAPVDLLWNGGIGTFVKSVVQSNSEAGDRTNDAIRINGQDLRCRVVGEGGNLGFTQLGRIEYALNSGQIYTDFIDNSAGVDCSDHEVNIKILLNQVVAQGDLTIKQRDKLLVEMTDDVARLVLQDNYRQTLALRRAFYSSFEEIDTHANYIRHLSENSLINRDIEFLPSDAAIIERKASGKGLSMPELAILFSYCKSIIKREILDSDLPEDKYLSSVVVYAFPRVLRERYRSLMDTHPLQREIIATILSNALVNEMGFTFVYELWSETGATVSEIMRAYAVTRNIFKISTLTDNILALDYVIDPVLQLDLLKSLSHVARSATRWILKTYRMELNLAKYRDYFEENVGLLIDNIPSLLCGEMLAEFNDQLKTLTVAKVHPDIARYIAAEPALISALDIIESARVEQIDVLEIAKIYFNLGEMLGISWLRRQAREYPIENHWDIFAREALGDGLAFQHCNLAISVMKSGLHFDTLDSKIKAWESCYQHHIERWHSLLSNIKSSPSISLAMLIYSIRALADMAQLSQQLICEVPQSAEKLKKKSEKIKS